MTEEVVMVVLGTWIFSKSEKRCRYDMKEVKVKKNKMLLYLK
jgi:hypothetical protein